jgi:hypothetical protein
MRQGKYYPSPADQGIFTAKHSFGRFEAVSEPRRRIVQTVSRLSRAANFRLQTLNAYGNRCAVTRAQLRLVDATLFSLSFEATESVTAARRMQHQLLNLSFNRLLTPTCFARRKIGRSSLPL